MREFWLGSTEGGGKKLTELITLPSLNIRGMASSRIGAQASNVIPATATATIDMRLVKGMDPRTTAERVIEHIRKQGFFVVDQEPTREMRWSHPKVAMVIAAPLRSRDAHVDGSADFAGSDPRGGKRARSRGEASEYGRQDCR